MLQVHAYAALHVAAADDSGEATAPASIPLIPAPDLGGTVIGRDGRAFRPDLSAIISEFNTEGTPVCVDWEHGTESYWREPDRGGRAAAWITRLFVQEGALYADVEWTPEGAKDVLERAYRFISPAIYSTEDGRAWKLSSAALTNRPNLKMPAVHTRQEQPPMKSVAQLLDLHADASEEAIVDAIKKIKSAPPDPEKWAPRADYLHAMKRAAEAETKLGEHARRSAVEKVDGILKEAEEAGKFSPASIAIHRETALGSDEDPITDPRVIEVNTTRLRRLVDSTPAAVHTTSQAQGGPPKKGQSVSAHLKNFAEIAGLKPETVQAVSQD